jgi:hypothetical protein
LLGRREGKTTALHAQSAVAANTIVLVLVVVLVLVAE